MRPVMSSSSSSRWSRRPFILVGGLLCALLFPFIWTPSAAWSETALFVYLAVFCLAYLTAHTIYSIAYEALGIELTDDTHARTRLYAFRGLFPPVLALGLVTGTLLGFAVNRFSARSAWLSACRQSASRPSSTPTLERTACSLVRTSPHKRPCAKASPRRSSPAAASRVIGTAVNKISSKKT